jgi:ABC-type thiamine transport system substrate-binding protein
MNIRKYLGASILSVALLLACCIPVLAKNSRTVVITYNAVLSGKTLPAGNYVVQWEAHNSQATVEFAQGHKVVLSTEGRLEDRGKKCDTTMVLYYTASNGTRTISEIRFAGSSEVLVFNQ